MIACLFMPYLAAALERQADPALAAQPLIISQASQVWAVSAAAARDGVKPGLSLRQAQTRCPQARLIPANPARMLTCHRSAHTSA